MYEHPWLQDVDQSLEIFTSEEQNLIKKEYTYNDIQRQSIRNDEEPADCFTEHDF